MQEIEKSQEVKKSKNQNVKTANTLPLVRDSHLFAREWVTKPDREGSAHRF